MRMLTKKEHLKYITKAHIILLTFIFFIPSGCSMLKESKQPKKIGDKPEEIAQAFLQAIKDKDAATFEAVLHSELIQSWKERNVSTLKKKVDNAGSQDQKIEEIENMSKIEDAITEYIKKIHKGNPNIDEASVSAEKFEVKIPKGIDVKPPKETYKLKFKSLYPTFVDPSTSIIKKDNEKWRIYITEDFLGDY